MNKAWLLLIGGIFLAYVNCEASTGGGHVVGNPMKAEEAAKPEEKTTKKTKEKSCDCSQQKKDCSPEKAKKGECQAKAEECDCSKKPEGK